MNAPIKGWELMKEHSGWHRSQTKSSIININSVGCQSLLVGVDDKVLKPLKAFETFPAAHRWDWLLFTYSSLFIFRFIFAKSHACIISVPKATK